MEVAINIKIGVANPNAHGQDITNTLHADFKANNITLIMSLNKIMSVNN